MDNTQETPLKVETVSHPDMVRALVKPGRDILESLTPKKCDLDHMTTGVVTEAGELKDASKRYTIYNKPIDRKNVIEELGDLEFYMEGVRQNLGISRQETLDANIVKLLIGNEKTEARYKEGKYTDEQASKRADKRGTVG